jgi:hypothetical protein
MSNFAQRLHNVANSPQDRIPNNTPLDPFHAFGNQDLSNLINAAANALRSRGYPPPPPPAFQVSPMPPRQSSTIPPPPPRNPPSPLPENTTMPTVSRMPDMWENAKVEQIICAGLKPPYDGTADNLIPTLNLINIRRRNEVWYSATIIEQDGKYIDLITQFSQVKEATISQNSKLLWDNLDATVRSHTRGTATYNNRLLGVFLLNSLTADFAALLHSRIDTKYCSDGALLLHTMCQHIHRNHLAFTESIKSKIRASLLSDFNNVVSKFLRHLHNNLKLISSTGDTENAHNDLIPHILTQLRGTTIPIFQQSVLKWQCEYFENKLTLTPQLLVSKADSECQILTHAGQWVKTIDNAQSGEILKAMIANFSQIHQQTRDSTRSYRHATRPSIRASNQQTPIWVNDPPTYPDQIRHHNGRTIPQHILTKYAITTVDTGIFVPNVEVTDAGYAHIPIAHMTTVPPVADHLPQIQMILITVYLGPPLGRALHTIAAKVDSMTAGRAQGRRATTVILHNKIHLNDGLHGSKQLLLLQLPSSLYSNRSIYSWTIMSNLIVTLCFYFVLMLIYRDLQQLVFDSCFCVIPINHIFKYLFFYCCYCYLYIVYTHTCSRLSRIQF